MKIKTGIGALLLTFLVTLEIGAQSRERNQRQSKPPTFEQLLEAMDANKDGMLSKKEVKGPLKEHFKTVDANEDGYITKKELENAPKPERRERNRN